MIYQMLHQLKKKSPETGGFVKQDPKTKRWYAVLGSAARTTTAQAFRDALSPSYKSSKQFKKHRRSIYKYTPDCGSRKALTSDNSNDSKLETVDTAPLSNVSVSVEESPVLDKEDIGRLMTVTDCAMERPFRPSRSSSMPPLVSPVCYEGKCTKEVDLDRLGDILGVEASTGAENPYEPTPISAAALFGVVTPTSSISSFSRRSSAPAVVQGDHHHNQCPPAPIMSQEIFYNGDAHGEEASSVSWETMVQEEYQNEFVW